MTQKSLPFWCNISNVSWTYYTAISLEIDHLMKRISFVKSEELGCSCSILPNFLSAYPRRIPYLLTREMDNLVNWEILKGIRLFHIPAFSKPIDFFHRSKENFLQPGLGLYPLRFPRSINKDLRKTSSSTYIYGGTMWIERFCRKSGMLLCHYIRHAELGSFFERKKSQRPSP